MSSNEVMSEASRTILDRLLAGEEVVKVPSLGSFKLSTREAHTARNPRNGEQVEVAAKTVVKFVVSDKLKDLVKEVEIPKE